MQVKKMNFFIAIFFTIFLLGCGGNSAAITKTINSPIDKINDVDLKDDISFDDDNQTRVNPFIKTSEFNLSLSADRIDITKDILNYSHELSKSLTFNVSSFNEGTVNSKVNEIHSKLILKQIGTLSVENNNSRNFLVKDSMILERFSGEDLYSKIIMGKNTLVKYHKDMLDMDGWFNDTSSWKPKGYTKITDVDLDFEYHSEAFHYYQDFSMDITTIDVVFRGYYRRWSNDKYIYFTEDTSYTFSNGSFARIGTLNVATDNFLGDDFAYQLHCDIKSIRMSEVGVLDLSLKEKYRRDFISPYREVYGHMDTVFSLSCKGDILDVYQTNKFLVIVLNGDVDNPVMLAMDDI